MAKHFRTDETGNFIVSPKDGETYTHNEDELLQLYLKGRGYDKGRAEFKTEREAFEKERTTQDEAWKRRANLLELYEESFGDAMEALLGEPDAAKAQALVERVRGSLKAKAAAEADDTRDDDEDLDAKPSKKGQVKPLTRDDVMELLEQRDMEKTVLQEVEDAIKPYGVSDTEALDDFKRTIFSKAARIPNANIKELTEKTLKSYGLKVQEQAGAKKATGGTRELSDLGGIAADGGAKKASAEIGSEDWRSEAQSVLDSARAARGG